MILPWSHGGGGASAPIFDMANALSHGGPGAWLKLRPITIPRQRHANLMRLDFFSIDAMPGQLLATSEASSL